MRSARQTDLAGFGEYDDVISLGRLDVGADVAELVVGDPARRLGVVGRRLRKHLLAVERQVLEVSIALERVREVRHDGGLVSCCRRRQRERQLLTHRELAKHTATSTHVSTFVYQLSCAC